VPTVRPPSGGTDSPTAKPNIHTASPTLAPEPCTRWSRWYNRDVPESGGGDIESMSPNEKEG